MKETLCHCYKWKTSITCQNTILNEQNYQIVLLIFS